MILKADLYSALTLLQRTDKRDLSSELWPHMPENSPGPFQIAEYFGHVVCSEDLVNIGKFVMFFRRKIRHGAFDEFEAISFLDIEIFLIPNGHTQLQDRNLGLFECHTAAVVDDEFCSQSTHHGVVFWAQFLSANLREP